MRKVIIATPSYDGKLCTEYVVSLIDTIALCNKNGISVELFTLSHVSLTQVARNSLFAKAYSENPECVIWLDADISWNPQDFLYLVNSDKDIIGAAYPRKVPQDLYVVKCFEPLDQVNDIIKVAGLGFGFIKLSYKVISDLWNISEPYYDDVFYHKNVFDVKIKNGELWSEDAEACQKILDLGYDIYLDKRIRCDHIGDKRYESNFYEWVNNLKL